MRPVYPEPHDLGFEIPGYLIRERFNLGFRHALKGGQIRQVEHLRRSFREGFRAGKLYCRHLRRRQGVVEFPYQGRIKLKTLF